MKLQNAMYVWNRETDQIAVIPWPDHDKLSKGYRMSDGACNLDFKNFTKEELRARVFIDAIHIIVRDRVPADAVHREFLKIDEYVEGLSNDMLPEDLLNKRLSEE